MAVIVFAIIGLFLPEEIYPKYTTPLPFCLPIKNRDNWIVYSVTLFIQIISNFTTGIHFIYSFCIFITISFHIMGYLDIILEVIEEIKSYLLIERDFDSTKKKKVMQAWNETSEETQQEKHWSYKEQIKELSDMISSLMM